MTILEEIIRYKKSEIIKRQGEFPVSWLEKQKFFERNIFSLKKELQRNDKGGIIAEFKRKSPSKSEINPHADIENVVSGYHRAGVSGISVLTDSFFFGGENEDLIKARENVDIPILRKDFMVDEYQFVEAKSLGADVVLLIAAALPPKTIKHLSGFAKSLNLEVLLEIHNYQELEDCLNDNIDMVGINNRNLKTFEVNIENSLKLVPVIPSEYVKISESGIEKASDVFRLKEAGFDGFLMGETFMKEKDPGLACASFIQELLNVNKNPPLTFSMAGVSDLPLIEKLAAKIWMEVYPNIISIGQIHYMLEKMYSLEILRRQMATPGNEFFLVRSKGAMVGYLHCSSENGTDFFIHKLYVDTSFHGKGVGKNLFDFVFLQKKQIKSICLQVNRKNDRAISFYKKLGFNIDYEKDFDIGGGFYMCDYVMKKLP